VPVSVPTYVTVWLVIVYMWVANYLIRMALGALLPPIMRDLGLSYSLAGVLSSALFWGYMTMQLPAGILGDRFGRRRMLMIGIAIGIVGCACTGLAGSLTALIAARVLTGLGQGFFFSNDRVLIGATTPPARIALGQGISFSGAGLGTTLGLILAGVLGTLMPWRWVFYLFTLPPLLALFLLWRFVPEPPHATAPPDPDWPFRRVVRTRDFWLLAVTGVAPAYCQFLLGTWGPMLFTEIGVTELARAASLSSFQGIVAPLGLVVSGILADRLHRRGLHRKLVIAGGLLLMVICLVAMAAVVRAHGSPALLAALVLATSLFMWCTWSPVYAIMGELFPPSVLGKAFGLLNCVVFLGGVASPTLTGIIRDHAGTFAPAVLVSAALPGVAMVLALWLRPAFALRAPGASLAASGGA
jgi:MFS family permease